MRVKIPNLTFTLALLLFVNSCEWIDHDRNVEMEHRITYSVEMVADIAPFSDSSSLDWLTDVDGNLFFSANDGMTGAELWKSDGTTAGTVLVKDISTVGSSSPNELAAVTGRLFFAADDGIHGNELWVSDGTGMGTVMVKDIGTNTDPYTPCFNCSDPYDLTELNGSLIFRAYHDSRGQELWTSDGTELGTQLIKDIRPGAEGGGIFGFTKVYGWAYFSANDGAHGRELWMTDGTEPGTKIVKNIYEPDFRGDRFPFGGSWPRDLAVINGLVAFTAYSQEQSWSTWITDGTADNTVPITEHNPAIASDAHNFVQVDHQFFFNADAGDGARALWVSDGTESGTRMIHHVVSVSPIAANGHLFFAADDGVHGQELWISDGSTSGTRLVADLNLTDGSKPEFLIASNGVIFFSANDGFFGREVWVSDGTSAGTTRISDIHPYGDSDPEQFTKVGDTVYFVAFSPTSGRELWKIVTHRVLDE